MNDYIVTFYWNKDKELILSINGEEIKLNPWVGVQLEEWRDNKRDWLRKDITVHEPNDLLNHLQKTGEAIKPIQRGHNK